MTPLRAAVGADEDEAPLWTPLSTGSRRGKPPAPTSIISPANHPYQSVASIRWPHFFHIFHPDLVVFCFMWPDMAARERCTVPGI